MSLGVTRKIVLFFPQPVPYSRSWRGVPLALLAISRVLDKEGYQIKIITRFLSENPEEEILREAKDCICVGFSAMTGFQISDGLKFAKLVKKKYPHVPLVWGGWHSSILPLETIKNENVDIVVKGQGDFTFPDLVHSLESGDSLGKIRGIVYKRRGRICENLDRPLSDINELPSLPYHLVDVNKCIFGTEYGQRTVPYISSYGCPHRCGFCVEQIVNKRKWISVKAGTVVKEWTDLVKKYQADSIAVYDSNFFVDQKRVYDICQGLLKKNIRIKWGNANGRVSQLVRYEPKVWRAMKKSGCSMILTGAESGSQNALDLIEKDMNVKDIVRFTALCKKYRIKILYSFLVGLPWSKDPGENEKFVAREYDATLSLIGRLLTISQRNRYTYYVFLPYPGAPLYQRAMKLGLKTPKSLEGWSTYLMSPEDAFKTVVRQSWITPRQARLTAMLTQYVFGLMDKDTFDVLKTRTAPGLTRIIFMLAYTIGLSLVRFRWRFRFFDYPVDYRLFTLIHKYSGLV